MLFDMTNKSTATIGKILAGARTLFLGRNYAAVTMDHIAAAAEVTKGALYHHFSSKEELYLAMMHANLEEARRLHQQGIDLDGTCRQRLRVLTGAFLSAPRAILRLAWIRLLLCFPIADNRRAARLSA